MPRRNTTLVLAAVVALSVAVAGVWWWRRRQSKRREPFLPIIPVASLIIGGISVGQRANLIQPATRAPVYQRPQQQQQQQQQSRPPQVRPTYSGRKHDGISWACPDGSVELGNEQASCITSTYHPPVTKTGSDGSSTEACPNGTAPTAESEWNKKCEVGWTSRVYSEADGKWACPFGTTDSGMSWDDGWYEGHKQCKRSKAYTTRILSRGKWVCPDGTRDTGKSWELGKDQGWKQCKWTGP